MFWSAVEAYKQIVDEDSGELPSAFFENLSACEPSLFVGYTARRTQPPHSECVGLALKNGEVS